MASASRPSIMSFLSVSRDTKRAFAATDMSSIATSPSIVEQMAANRAGERDQPSEDNWKD